MLGGSDTLTQALNLLPNLEAPYPARWGYDYVDRNAFLLNTGTLFIV